MEPIAYKAIGIIRTPFTSTKGTPIQPIGGVDAEGVVEVFPEYAEGLEDIEGFSHLILLYHLHLAKPYRLKVKPFMDDVYHGLFATRAPSRPNAIGLSVVRLLEREGNRLNIREIDIIDGAPLLDIKPYVPAFDAVDAEKIGWLDSNVRKADSAKDDGRFSR